METFTAILHIVVALILVALVLVQDTKTGSVGGAFGGGGSSSVLGATGAATLAQRLTRWTAVIFALTSITLSMFSSRVQRSVMDGASATAAPAPVTTPLTPSTGMPVSPPAGSPPVTGSSATPVTGSSATPVTGSPAAPVTGSPAAPATH